jgi:hypothetical protein
LRFESCGLWGFSFFLFLRGLKRAFIVFFLKLNRFGLIFSVLGLSNQNRTELDGFLKILIDFFLRFGFFGYFFSSFLGLIGFSVFLLTPTYCGLWVSKVNLVWLEFLSFKFFFSIYPLKLALLSLELSIYFFVISFF